MHSIVMLLLHNSCRYSHIDSNTTFSLGLYSLSLRRVSASVKTLLTVLAVLMIWIPPITRTVWKNANRWLNKELHSTYAYIVFRQLSLVVSPDLLVARHFPPRVWRRTSFVIPTLVVRFRKQESTTIPTTTVGMSAERSGVLCPPTPQHCTQRSASPVRRMFFKRASQRVSWLDFAAGLDATEPFAPPPRQALLPHPPPYLLLLLADRQPSQILVRRIHLINSFVFQLLMVIRQLSVSSMPTFLCVFLCFAALCVDE